MLISETSLISDKGLHWFFQHRRYNEIAELSRSLDQILHGQDTLLDDSAEGELAILRSEIRKMNVRLRESADLLQKDTHECNGGHPEQEDDVLRRPGYR